MSSKTSNVFIGSTARMSSLSCDSVIAGAFFPQSDSHVPEKEVSQHTSNHMVTPSRILSYFVVVHSQIRFGLLKALLNGPTNPREPDKGLQSCRSACVRDEVGVYRFLSNGATDNQPNSFIWFSVLGQNHPFLHKLIGYRTFCPLRDLSLIHIS